MVCSPPVVSKCLGEAHRRLELFTLFFFPILLVIFFQVQPYNRKYRCIGHRVWSISLNILTELSVNLFNSAEPSAQSVIVMQF